VALTRFAVQAGHRMRQTVDSRAPDCSGAMRSSFRPQLRYTTGSSKDAAPGKSPRPTASNCRTAAAAMATVGQQRPLAKSAFGYFGAVVRFAAVG